ncbi:hypothetical protein SAMN05216312_101743 [Cohnella sp. OV330]|uniref:hypothetical protein n=1 Tax=Cohnella sp. OV330 TaxID=1855288 RepID=UPI0008E00C37|nr:hypothetical protein [Cohnella sp. OV330]SFA82895.1 hypothetical protein SAMN05216312_101743 [Cohnella sp. OV330]
MKKLLFAFIALVVLIAVGSVILFQLIKPAERLDLAYEPVKLESKAMQMFKDMSTELVLSEADVNNLAKESIARNPMYGPDVLITGARFRLLSENRLAADVNLKIKDRIPVGLTIVYRLKWASPNLTAEVQEASIRGVPLPADQFDDVVIPLGAELPKVVRIKDVSSNADGLKVSFRMPSASELRELIGGL